MAKPETIDEEKRAQGIAAILLEAAVDVSVELGRLARENRELRERSTAERGGLREARDCLAEALEGDDFQPCFSGRNHMVGPALRGCIERALAALEGK